MPIPRPLHASRNSDSAMNPSLQQRTRKR
jgi:hypothetical protein